MSTELSAFIDSDEGSRLEERLDLVIKDLLVFECGGDLYGLPAGCVDGVVTWKLPAPVPGSDRRVRGVLQDRGRIVVLMVHPTGRSDRDAPRDAKRIVICQTPRGLIGLPATSTRAVGPVELNVEPTPFAVHDSKLGPFTYLDPTKYGEER